MRKDRQRLVHGFEDLLYFLSLLIKKKLQLTLVSTLFIPWETLEGSFRTLNLKVSTKIFFRILFQILLIPVSRTFHGEARSFSGFLQVSVKIFYCLWVQDPSKIYSRSCSGSQQENTKRIILRFHQNFNRNFSESLCQDLFKTNRYIRRRSCQE